MHCTLHALHSCRGGFILGPVVCEFILWLGCSLMFRVEADALWAVGGGVPCRPERHAVHAGALSDRWVPISSHRTRISRDVSMPSVVPCSRSS